MNNSKYNKKSHLLKSPLGDLGVTPNMFYGAPPILFEFAKNLRNNSTEAEIFLWNFLKSGKIENVRFRRQHPLFYFVADFYCHKAKLVVEVDGGYHRIPEQYEYDINRDAELERFGIKVLRFSNEQVFSEIEKVIAEITEDVKRRVINAEEQPLNPLKGTCCS